MTRIFWTIVEEKVFVRVVVKKIGFLGLVAGFALSGLAANTAGGITIEDVRLMEGKCPRVENYLEYWKGEREIAKVKGCITQA